MDSHIRTSQLDQELQGRKRDQDSEAEGGGKRGVSRGARGEGGTKRGVSRGAREGQGEELAGGQGEGGKERS